MQRLSICLIVFTCLVVGILAVDGVKGGHRQRPNGNFHGTNSSQNGLCYKRVPYSHVLTANDSGTPYNTIPQPPGGHYPQNDGWITILDCCDGYERNVTTSHCEPKCEHGCFGGRCTGPNICTCQPGWRAENGVCMPVCSYRCQENAYCYLPEVCMCKLGYDEIEGQCKPICPDGCSHGECVAPRICSCRPGYVMNERKDCVPACEGGCVHGVCSGPGVCTCSEGYINPPGDRESCMPHCPTGCHEGECIAPNICSCRPGYTRDRYGRCIPGTTGSSQCGYGYTVDPDTGRCMPVTTTPIPQSGDCRYTCGPHGRCVGYNRCVCERGFIVDPDTGRCISNITSTINSTLTLCRIGHEPGIIDRDTGRCIPVTTSRSDCIYGCGLNGVCVGHNRCLCERGFISEPDTGRCIPHAVSTTDSTLTQCRFGYESGIIDPDTGRCIPVTTSPTSQSSDCRYGCGPNGRCVGPNRCVCEPGFRVNSDTGRCIWHDVGDVDEQICQHPCLNGQCTGPDQCTCNHGYTHDVRDPTRSRCVPVCAGGCPNGVCTAPNFCICNAGYRKEGVKGRQRCVPQE